MDFESLRSQAKGRLEPLAWEYYEGVAGGDRDEEHRAWQRLAVVPRVMRGLTSIDSTVTIGGVQLSTPVMVAATAAHALSHPEAEIATGSGATAAGALMCYSSSAGLEVGVFGAAMTAPWWAQVYVMQDRARSDDYVARCVAAGAGALVLTVDNVGSFGDAPFRVDGRRGGLTAAPGNFPGLTWEQMSALIEPNLTPDNIREMIAATGLPVWVKGVMHPDDAVAAVDAGATGVMVSNHGRRQVEAVVPAAIMLAEVVAAVDGRAPVLVDGGIRSGIDVLRALALGAAGVALGRPILWALAAQGATGVTAVLNALSEELRQAMASAGAASISDITADLVRVRTW